MRGSDFALGVPLGLASFYGLSLASAYWIAPVPGFYTWGLAISAAVCGVLALILALRPSTAVVLAATMLVGAIVGLAFGSDAYLSVPPFPGALLQLLFHGSRSAVVFGPMVLVGTAAITMVMSRRRYRPTRPN